jgi:hypothetical protein
MVISPPIVSFPVSLSNKFRMSVNREGTGSRDVVAVAREIGNPRGGTRNVMLPRSNKEREAKGMAQKIKSSLVVSITI